MTVSLSLSAYAAGIITDTVLNSTVAVDAARQARNE
jgi:hypothetical protein